MKLNSEITGLVQIAGEKKGLLIVARLFSVLLSLMQIVPYIAVYKIVDELLMNAQHPAGIDKGLILNWGIVSYENGNGRIKEKFSGK